MILSEKSAPSGQARGQAFRDHALAHRWSCREQLSPVMSGDGDIEDQARSGRDIEPNRHKLLAMAAVSRNCEHPAGRADLRLEMALESRLAFFAQPARALLHHLARDLRHA